MDNGESNLNQPVPQGSAGSDIGWQRDRSAAPVPGQYGSYYHEEEEVDLREYIAVIIRRRWTILAFLLVTVVTTAIFTFKMKPVYKATATLEISFEQPQVTPFGNEAQARLIEQARYIQSQVEIIKSRNLAGKVIDVLNLKDSPEFKKKEKGPFFRWLDGVKRAILSVFSKGSREGSHIDPEIAEREALIDKFVKRLKVNPLKGGKSYLLAVSFEAHNPRLAAKVVNTLLDEYIAFDLEKRIEATKVGKQYLEKQIAKVQARLEEAEERLNKFARENNIVFLSQLGEGGQGQDVVTARLSELTNELVKVQADRIRLEALYNQSLKNPDSLPQVMNDTLIKRLKEQLAGLKAEYANLSTVFTDRYPKMKRLKKQIASLQAQIARERRKIVSSIRAEYLAALKREEMIKKAFEAQKKRLADLKQKAIDYNILKREVDTNRKIYELLLQRSKEMDVEASVRSTTIHPIDRALVPLSPYKPKKALNLLLSFIVGLAGGIFLAFLLEYFDNSIKSPDEVERVLGLPILGIVPNISTKKSGRSGDSSWVELHAVRSSKSPAAEAFRMVRTSLTLATPSGPPKSILVTSPQVGGGKTFVALNLAAVYSHMDSKVVLVDCDLRKPRLHRILKVRSSPGLSNYLAGGVDLESVIRSVDGTLGDGFSVDFIPAGTVPPNPVELINSKSFVYMLELLKEKYDCVIIDSPPLIGFADSLVLSRLADGTVIVIRNQQTPRPAAKHAKEQLIQVGGRVLGVIVNDVKAERGGYYHYGKYYHYYHYYHYSKYYGYYDEKELPGDK